MAIKKPFFQKKENRVNLNVKILGNISNELSSLHATLCQIQALFALEENLKQGNDNADKILPLQITFGEFVEDVINSTLNEPVVYVAGDKQVAIKDLRKVRETLSEIIKNTILLKNIDDILEYIEYRLEEDDADEVEVNFNDIDLTEQVQLVSDYIDEKIPDNNGMYFKILRDEDLEEIICKITGESK